MRISQVHISRAVEFFSERLRGKYDLKPYSRDDEPLVIFGLYYPEDYNILKQHPSSVVVVWRGSDSMRIEENRIKVIRSRPNVRHIAISGFISQSLKKFDIPHDILPITSTPVNVNPVPRGDAVYCYYASGKEDAYNYDLAQEAIRRMRLRSYFATSKTYSKDQLMGFYKDCFLGLRLTHHDGLPNTVLELGLMGRRSIYNGDIPHSIPWENIDDICESIMVEYEHRHESNKHIAESVGKFLDIGDDWLHV